MQCKVSEKLSAERDPSVLWSSRHIARKEHKIQAPSCRGSGFKADQLQVWKHCTADQTLRIEAALQPQETLSSNNFHLLLGHWGMTSMTWGQHVQPYDEDFDAAQLLTACNDLHVVSLPKLAQGFTLMRGHMQPCQGAFPFDIICRVNRHKMQKMKISVSCQHRAGLTLTSSKNHLQTWLRFAWL